MTKNNFIKKLINEELNRFDGKLYIFDFDQTLVEDDALAYVVDQNGNRIKSLTHSEYRIYVSNPDETIDISEFEKVNNPINNDDMMNKIRLLQKNSVVLTARVVNAPIVKYLLAHGIDVPVFAVGSRDPSKICSAYNAAKKAKWVKAAIETFNLNYIEFWDDNAFNLECVKNLSNEFPNVKIIVHLVEHFNN